MSAADRGAEALANGRWQEARAAFDEALREQESAAVYESLSWASWWLNDGGLTLRSREAAYRLYRQSGDPLSAARMALWLASDFEDFRGELSVARGWRQRARRLLENVPLASEHGWLHVMEADAAFLVEDAAGARESAQAAMAVARQTGPVDIAVLALALEGLALVSEGNVDAGMTRLDEAAASALGGELSDPIWSSRVLCYLIFACERVRDFERAAEWCERMREAADAAQLAFAQAVCRWHYAGVLISRGRWDEAEARLSDALTLIEQSRPAYMVEGWMRLADLRRKQGRFDEAEEIYRRDEWHPLALVGLAELALETGRPQDAGDFVQRYLRQIPESNRLQRIAGMELQVRVDALRGRHAQAEATLETLKALSDAVATTPLRAAAAFSAAMVAIARRDLEAARVSLEDAVDLFDRSATPYEAARARLELASVLVSAGRLERARHVAGAARDQLHRLGSMFFSRRAAALVDEIDRRESEQAADAADGRLTLRQAEILRWISRGASDRDIARRLGLSEHTVHRHVANILVRLDAPTRAAAVALAAARRLI